MALSDHQQHEFKLVKRRLSALQRALKTALEAGHLPRKIDAAEFEATSRDMNDLCEPGWQAAMVAYMNRLEKFHAAMADGNPKTVYDRFQELLDCKISCHKEFR
jgi:XXXCH domain-containing protein